MGCSNVNLLHYETQIQSREFLDKTFSASLLPHIAIPTRVTPRSKILIDNIFTNSLELNSLFGNIICSISNHLAQYLIYISKPVINNFNQKEKLHGRNFKSMDKEKFKEALESSYWNEILVTYSNDQKIIN